VIRVAIADDHPLVRRGLSRVLAASGVVVTGEASTGSEAVELVRQSDPDVVLLDVRMPDVDGLVALREIKRECPSVRVIMVTAYDEPTWLVQAIAYGAAGYLPKTMAPEELIAAVKTVMRGEEITDPAHLAAIIQQLGSEMAKATLPLVGDLNRVTPRESEVLALVAEGLTNQQIAGLLGIAASTVKSHVDSLITKLGAANRTQAAVMAAKAKLV